MSSLSVAVEPADQPDVDRLLSISDAIAERLYPGAFREALTGRSLERPDAELLMARLSGAAVGCVVLLALDKTSAEIKRMIVDPAHARKGVGRSLILACLEVARRRGLARLMLEVGVRNTGARCLYESVGFRDRGPFGSYRQTTIATFMQYDLGGKRG